MDTNIKKSYRILVAGDIMPSASNNDTFIKGDAKKLYGEQIIKLFEEVDFSIANLEGVLTDSEFRQEKNGPVIKAPLATVNGLKALGLSAVSLANNHTTDAGQQGITETIEALKKSDILPIGYGLKNKEKRYTTVYLGKNKVCIYCVSEVFFNEPTEQQIGAYIYDEFVVCNELRELKKNHDYIIVLYHGGAEYFQYATPLVRKRCHRMIDCGADFIFTQHTHCIGCEEYYNNGYILHGQGNFLFARQKSHPELTREGLLVELCFDDKNIKIIKHAVITIEKKYVRYNTDYSFDTFKQRSEQNKDTQWVHKLYREVKVHEIANWYLSAYKGRSLYWKLVGRFFPSKYQNLLLNSYARWQILIIMDTLHCTRRNESMYEVWQYILDNNTVKKQQ